MAAPSVALQPPLGWVDATSDLIPPPISEGAGATLTQWRASRDVTRTELLVHGCISTPIPGWVEDLRPTVQVRSTSFTRTIASRLVALPVELRSMAGDQFAIELHADGAPLPSVGSARNLLGFGPHEVVTCFAVCVSTKPAATGSSPPRACDASVTGARLEGGVAAPPPGVALGAVTWAVHNPMKAVMGAAAVTLTLGMLAVLGRRRPRSRI